MKKRKIVNLLLVVAIVMTLCNPYPQLNAEELSIAVRYNITFDNKQIILKEEDAKLLGISTLKKGMRKNSSNVTVSTTELFEMYLNSLFDNEEDRNAYLESWAGKNIVIEYNDGVITVYEENDGIVEIPPRAFLTRAGFTSQATYIDQWVLYDGAASRFYYTSTFLQSQSGNTYTLKYESHDFHNGALGNSNNKRISVKNGKNTHVNASGSRPLTASTTYSFTAYTDNTPDKNFSMKHTYRYK